MATEKDCSLLDLFVSSFDASRARFRASADALNALITSYDVPTATSCLQGKLAIDIAYVGEESAENIVLHIAGTHGIEGFVGSAIQHAIMKSLVVPRPGVAFVLVHCLNPWGMSMLRRTNEANVDLNRNSVPHDADRVGAPEGYDDLCSLLMPRSASSFPLFAARAVLKVLMHGYAAVKQCITQGQFSYPRGLFFGGKETQQELLLFGAWLKENLLQARRVVAIDVHSGLGDFGQDYFLLDNPIGSEEYQRAVKIFGAEKIQGPDPAESVSYVTTGSLRNLLASALPHCELTGVVQEFGTYSGYRVIYSLVEENRRYFASQAGVGDVRDDALREIFCPASASWRISAVKRGLAAFQAAAAGIA